MGAASYNKGRWTDLKDRAMELFTFSFKIDHRRIEGYQCHHLAGNYL